MKISKEFRRFSAYDGYGSCDRISVSRSQGIWSATIIVLCGGHVVSKETFTGRKDILRVLGTLR